MVSARSSIRSASMQLGDSEIEQLRHRLRRHQDVAGLQVAVHDQVLVRVLHGVADLAKQLEPRRDRQTLLVAVLVDRLAVHVLHDEVRRTLGRRTAVEEAGDVRMVQFGENLALGAEAALHEFRREADRMTLIATCWRYASSERIAR